MPRVYWSCGLNGLEDCQKDGMNQLVLQNLKLSLEDVIESTGMNDDYVKEMFILSAVLKDDTCTRYPTPVPHQSSYVLTTVEQQISPEEIEVVDPFTSEMTPILKMDLIECRSRDQEKFLAIFRQKQELIWQNNK